MTDGSRRRRKMAPAAVARWLPPPSQGSGALIRKLNISHFGDINLTKRLEICKITWPSVILFRPMVVREPPGETLELDGLSQRHSLRRDRVRFYLRVDTYRIRLRYVSNTASFVSCDRIIRFPAQTQRKSVFSGRVLLRLGAGSFSSHRVVRRERASAGGSVGSFYYA
jgi:hypothetical protein